MASDSNHPTIHGQPSRQTPPAHSAPSAEPSTGAPSAAPTSTPAEKRCTEHHPEDHDLQCTLPHGHDGMHTILPSHSLWDALD